MIAFFWRTCRKVSSPLGRPTFRTDCQSLESKLQIVFLSSPAKELQFDRRSFWYHSYKNIINRNLIGSLMVAIHKSILLTSHYWLNKWLLNQKFWFKIFCLWKVIAWIASMPSMRIEADLYRSRSLSMPVSIDESLDV